MHKLIGLFGGTFDPVHLGHTNIIQSAINECQLDEVIVIPNHIPPHKNYMPTNGKHRLAMLKLACNDLPQTTISTLELDREGPSYTIDTLTEIKEQQPNNSYCLIIGEDSLANIKTWYCWEMILSLTHLIVYPRHTHLGIIQTANQLQLNNKLSNNPKDLMQSTSSKIYPLQQPKVNINATRIRQQLTQSDDCSSADINLNVLNYIKKNNLYRP